MSSTSEALARVADALAHDGLLTVLTGAGVSAASGIPTFRGPEGYWTVGSVEYTPQQLATRGMFARDPGAVWSWYLYRLGVCRAAQPNAAHQAIVELEQTLGDRFQLITQNVDGLHLRAGNSTDRTFAVHGELEWVRCAQHCTSSRWAVPAEVSITQREQALTDADRRALTCPQCGGWLRPDVLWFDESYNEEWFRFDSALRAAERTAVLVTVGTSGATTLPALVAQRAAASGALLIDVNPNANPFATLAARSGGVVLRAQATDALPELATQVARHVT